MGIRQVFEDNLERYQRIMENELGLSLGDVQLHRFDEFEPLEFSRPSMPKQDLPIVAWVSKGIYYNRSMGLNEGQLKFTLLHELVHIAQPIHAGAPHVLEFYDKRMCNKAIPYDRDEALADYIASRIGKRLRLPRMPFYSEALAELEDALRRKHITRLDSAMRFVLEDRVGQETECKAPGTFAHYKKYLKMIRKGMGTNVCYP